MFRLSGSQSIYQNTSHRLVCHALYRHQETMLTKFTKMFGGFTRLWDCELPDPTLRYFLYRKFIDNFVALPKIIFSDLHFTYYADRFYKKIETVMHNKRKQLQQLDPRFASDGRLTNVPCLMSKLLSKIVSYRFDFVVTPDLTPSGMRRGLEGGKKRRSALTLNPRRGLVGGKKRSSASYASNGFYPEAEGVKAQMPLPLAVSTSSLSTSSIIWKVPHLTPSGIRRGLVGGKEGERSVGALLRFALPLRSQHDPVLTPSGGQGKKRLEASPLGEINKEQLDRESSSSSKTESGVVLWERPTFPFTAIVGQEEMKLALLLNVIDPKIGGVMIMGDRGTGKSTTVRALVDLLPNIEVIDNDPFNSHPVDTELQSQNVREQVLQAASNPEGVIDIKVVWKKTAMIDLPLGATEDRVCGTIDIEKALSEGIKSFEPGLLAKANRGILYVDEVNLLDDHLVDILLDSAASGWNTVEREGISISHPARFILVGSGNPEEGELRPQLLDRFGMHAQIGTVREAELRVKIVEERAKFDKSPLDFLSVHLEKQKQLADKIVAARNLLGTVNIDYDLRVKISQVCGQLNVDGLRGDIVTNRASQALAAFEARTNVTPHDIFRVIPLCLRHRLRKDPLESIDSGDRVRETFRQIFGFFSD